MSARSGGVGPVTGFLQDPERFSLHPPFPLTALHGDLVEAALSETGPRDARGGPPQHGVVSGCGGTLRRPTSWATIRCTIRKRTSRVPGMAGRPRCVFLAGPSSAGKTSLALAFQRVAEEPWFFFEADRLSGGFPSSRSEFVTL